MRLIITWLSVKLKVEKKYVIYGLLSLLPLLYNVYSILFAGFTPNKLEPIQGVLRSMPTRKEIKAGFQWEFRLNNNSNRYHVNYLNPAQITQKKIWKMQAGDTVILYTYRDFGFINFIDYLNGTKTVVGIEWKNNKYLYYNRIADRMNEVYIMSLCFVILSLGLVYYQWFYLKKSLFENKDKLES